MKNQRQQNLVAKYCCKFNKPKVEVDRKTSYRRKEKHCKGREVDHFLVLIRELKNDLLLPTIKR